MLKYSWEAGTGVVPVGTNQMLAPADTEPLHFTRLAVYTQQLVGILRP